MGLAIARGIVQAHGGKIWIEDGPERRGTSVQFMVPLNDALMGPTAENNIPKNDVSQNDNVAMAPGSSRVVTPGGHS
jgi:hypothetical protein